MIDADFQSLYEGHNVTLFSREKVDSGYYTVGYKLSRTGLCIYLQYLLTNQLQVVDPGHRLRRCRINMVDPPF